MSSFRMLRLGRQLTTLATLGVLGCGPSLLAGCSGHSGNAPPGGGPAAQRNSGQTSFVSSPMAGQSSGGASGSFAAGAGGGATNAGTPAPAAAGPSGSTSTTPTRTVQETDLYRVEGNRLYYLNSYRGLMVFDVTNPDAPQLLGRHAIFGDPQEMIVQNGVAVVVVGDWYGIDQYGAPFHGSVIRGLDANDPTNIKTVGEVMLPGWVQDTRVVGNVLYAVLADYGWEYGWYGDWVGYYGGGGGVAVPAGGVAVGNSGAGGANGPKVSIASVNFAGGVVAQAGYQQFPNSTGGVFNVTPNSIMLASDVSPNNGQGNVAGLTNLQYVDISDPAGAIKLRGAITVSGALTGWGPDNGRWNLDFADGITAHAIGCADQYCGDNTDSYLLSTVDFSNPDAPVQKSQLAIPNLGWSAAARFSGSLLYLSPNGYYGGNNTTTPFSIYDLSSPTAPKLAGTTSINGSVWLYLPDGTRLFSVGNTSYNGGSSSQVDVQYLDVSNPAAPKVLGTSAFGSGWAWTPAADTFKAFTLDDTKGLAVVPFSGWDPNGQSYANGVQLIQYTPSGIVGGGAAHTKGWVQRGIFVNGRLFSLSDQALASIDYSNPSAPRVVNELTLARNVINAQPQGATIAELSSDWWGNDNSTSEMRVLPIANAAETTDNGKGISAFIKGVDAQVFQNGNLAYVVTEVQSQGPCNTPWGGPVYPGGAGGTGPSTCPVWTQQVQVVDTSNGGATLRGQVSLPLLPTGWGGWGWWGFWWYDWFDGSNVVQVDGNKLAFRRWFPQYAYNPNGGGWSYVDELDSLYVVDLTNPDAPSLASMTITDDTETWWGDMQAVGNTLYTTHYEWVNRPDPKNPSGTDYYVKYYLDQVDLSDPSHPKIGQKINVPGVLVGASSSDSSILYLIDYRWDSNDHPRNDFDVVKIDGGLAYLQSTTEIDGWVGNVIVQNDRAYMSAEEYDWMVTNTGGTYTPPYVELHQIDVSNPQKPVDRVSTDVKNGWGWLLGVQGDRAIVTSGWGPVGVDIYKLSDTAAPAFDQSVRTEGWGGADSISRQGNTLYLSSGYWGVQPVVLQ